METTNNRLRLCVLVACMYEKDYSIVKRSNIQTDAVVVNQCDEEKIDKYSFKNKKGKECNVIFINTKERGLSCSRNMALRNAINSDVCLICDDDEILDDDYEEKIIRAFEHSKQADIIAFNIKRPKRKPFKKIRILYFFEALKISSVHITFRRSRILDKRIQFDVMLGSGSGNGGGEDTRFMRDCYQKKLKIVSNPEYIGSLVGYNKPSVWFKGYNKQFFIDSGWVTRRIFGGFLSILKLLHFAIYHWKSYKDNINFLGAVYYSFIGWRQKR